MTPQSSTFHAGTYGFHRPPVTPVLLVAGIAILLVAAVGAGIVLLARK